jgi:hypothetical protein
LHKDGNLDDNSKNIPIGDQFKVDDFALRALVHPMNKAAKEEEEVEENDDDNIGYDNFDELQQESIKLSERLQKQIIDDSEVRYPYLLPTTTCNQQLDNTSLSLSSSSSTAMDYDFREEKSYLRRATAEAVLKALLEPISDYTTSQSSTGEIPENSIRNSIDMNSKVVKSYVSKMNQQQQQQQQQQNNDVLENINTVPSTDTDHDVNDSNDYDNEVVDGLANIGDISRSAVDGSSDDMDVDAYIDDDSHVGDDQIDDLIVSSQFNDRIVDDKSPLGNTDHHHHLYSLPSPELLMHSGYEDHVYDDEVEPSSQYSKRRIARHVSNTSGGEEEEEDEEGYDIPTITYDGENFHIQDNIFNRPKQYVIVSDEYNNTAAAAATTTTSTFDGCDDNNHDNINVDSPSSIENELNYLSPSNNQYYEDDYLLSIDSKHHHYHHPPPNHGNNNDIDNNEQQQFDYEEDL